MTHRSSPPSRDPDGRIPEAEPHDDARHDPHFERHGVTAEDGDGVADEEEGFLAEGYPGHNPLRGESAREERRRELFTWTWPQVPEDGRGPSEVPAGEEQRIALEIGRRILLAQPDVRRATVEVEGGAVTLRGEVETVADRRVVEGLARAVRGVRSIESRLRVRRPGHDAAT